MFTPYTLTQIKQVNWMNVYFPIKNCAYKFFTCFAFELNVHSFGFSKHIYMDTGINPIIHRHCGSNKCRPCTRSWCIYLVSSSFWLFWKLAAITMRRWLISSTVSWHSITCATTSNRNAYLDRIQNIHTTKQLITTKPNKRLGFFSYLHGAWKFVFRMFSAL